MDTTYCTITRDATNGVQVSTDCPKSYTQLMTDITSALQHESGSETCTVTLTKDGISVLSASSVLADGTTHDGCPTDTTVNAIAEYKWTGLGPARGPGPAWNPAYAPQPAAAPYPAYAPQPATYHPAYAPQPATYHPAYAPQPAVVPYPVYAPQPAAVPYPASFHPSYSPLPAASTHSNLGVGAWIGIAIGVVLLVAVLVYGIRTVSMKKTAKAAAKPALPPSNM